MKGKITVEEVANGFIIEANYMMQGVFFTRKRVETRLDRMLRQVEKHFEEKE